MSPSDSPDHPGSILYPVQNLQWPPIPQTSNWSGTIFCCFLQQTGSSTGKSLSEALIFASTNPQYDHILVIELQIQYMKIPSSNLGKTCCVQKLFLTFRTIFVHNMFSPYSAKRRASDKDLPVY